MQKPGVVTDHGTQNENTGIVLTMTTCWSSTMRTSSSSHWQLTCSRHDIKLKILLRWGLNNNHSLTITTHMLQYSRQNVFWWNQCKHFSIQKKIKSKSNWLEYEDSIAYTETHLGLLVWKRVGLSRTIQHQWEPFYCMP